MLGACLRRLAGDVLLWGDTGGCVVNLASRQCTVVLPPVPVGQPPTGMPDGQLRSMYPYTLLQDARARAGTRLVPAQVEICHLVAGHDNGAVDSEAGGGMIQAGDGRHLQSFVRGMHCCGRVTDQWDSHSSVTSSNTLAACGYHDSWRMCCELLLLLLLLLWRQRPSRPACQSYVRALLVLRQRDA